MYVWVCVFVCVCACVCVFMHIFCFIGCPYGYYGDSCDQHCGMCTYIDPDIYNPCDLTGSCINGCQMWWITDNCQTEIGKKTLLLINVCVSVCMCMCVCVYAVMCVWECPYAINLYTIFQLNPTTKDRRYHSKHHPQIQFSYFWSR